MSQQTLLLEGNIGLISFPNLVQLIKLEQKTAKIELQRVEIGQSATMYFHNGALTYANVNSLYGEEAMFRIICWWQTGTFHVYQVAPENLPAANIKRQVDWILLEGMRRMDECGAFRKMLPQITSCVSFTQKGLDAFRWDGTEPPEWIPHWMRQLPRSFSMAQMFDSSCLGEMETCNCIKALLATQALGIHGENEQGAGIEQRTRFDSFALIVMEYVGYEMAHSLVEGACRELGIADLEKIAFGQMLDVSDRLGMAISRMVGFDQGQDAMRKLRARITSLI